VSASYILYFNTRATIFPIFKLEIIKVHAYTETTHNI